MAKFKSAGSKKTSEKSATQSDEAAGFVVVKDLNELKKVLWKLGGQAHQ